MTSIQPQWNACAVCGEQVTTRTRITGYTAWQTDDGEVIDKETVLVVHPACYLRLAPDDQQRLLREHAPDPGQE